MINLKTYENFSGRIKYTKPEDLDTQEVIELINILFELKPSLPDEFPKADLSKLIRNEVTYLSDDDRFNIKVGFSENDTYVNKEGELVTGKYKTIFKVNIVRNIEDDEASTFKLSEVKEYILLTSQLVEKTYENFTGKIKYTKPEDLDTHEVIELINILFELKPSLPDEFPKADLSKLIRNEVIYSSDDDRFNIKVGFSENDTYVNKEGELVTGKYKTIFRVNIIRTEKESFKISEVKEYILLTSQLVEKTYDKVKMLVDVDDNKLSIEDFEKLSDNTELNEVTFLIKIL